MPNHRLPGRNFFQIADFNAARQAHIASETPRAHVCRRFRPGFEGSIDNGFFER